MRLLLKFAAATLAVEAARIAFHAPVVIGAGYYCDNFFGLESPIATTLVGGRVSGDESGAYQSLDGGRSWTKADPSVALDGIDMVRPTANSLRDFGTATEVPNPNGLNWNFSSQTANMLALRGAVVMQTPANLPTHITFNDIPQPTTCYAKFGGCPFRLAGGSLVTLSDGVTLLYSTIVKFASQVPSKYSTSIVCFASVDGGVTWNYRSIIANSTQYPKSQEGPNENAMAVLADGSVLVVMRVDAGDGPESHPYSNYESLISRDGGYTWQAQGSLPDQGCARPRLLRLAQPSALLLSGGRHRNANTTDVIVWLDSTATGAGPWTEYSISYWHNTLIQDASLKFTSFVNSTAEPRETTSYTSLIPVTGCTMAPGCQDVVITYNRYLPGVPNVAFAMRMSVTDA